MQKITQSSELYPTSLRHIPHPPQQLYIKGQPKVLNNFCIAVVGTRRPSQYGKMQTERITDFLAKNGVTIVSGFAYGIDIISHEIALKNNTPTIAVLGSGLENIYPASHKKYVEKIAQNGAIITEYEPTEQPLQFHFPQRNRIIAGISQAVVVIEAPEKSGSLITAQLALEYNKDVFAVPCDVDKEIGIGAIRAIQSCGAYPIISPEEIFEQMNLQIKMPFTLEPDICPTGLSKNTLTVYSALSKKSPKTIDQLAIETRLLMPEITSIISLLEIQGLIEKIGPGIIKTRIIKH